MKDTVGWVLIQDSLSMHLGVPKVLEDLPHLVVYLSLNLIIICLLQVWSRAQEGEACMMGPPPLHTVHVIGSAPGPEGLVPSSGLLHLVL